MQSRVSKWGNSLGIRLPKLLAEEAGLKDGETVELLAGKDEVIVRKMRPYRLDELVALITPQNIHSEIESGNAIGQEIW